MNVSVLVPYRESCPDRARAWEWVRAQYAQYHPDWEVIEGTCEGGWSKGRAVADALSRAHGDVLVVADADVWTDIGPAVDAVDHVKWAQPHRRVIRLSLVASLRVYAGEPLTIGNQLSARAEQAYSGVPGGGIVVLERATYEECPIDVRFVGWGGEDLAWGAALGCLYGGEFRGNEPLWHFWHEPQIRLSRSIGNPANERLRRRYQAARNDRRVMGLLLDEAREAACHSTGS